MSVTPSQSQIVRRAGVRDGTPAIADAHRFLDRRVQLFAKLLFFFLGGFTLIGIAKRLTLSPELFEGYAGAADTAIVTFGLLTAGIGFDWFYLRRRLRSIWMLHFLESFGTVCASAVFCSLVYLFPIEWAYPGVILLVVLTLVIRAALVPSAIRRTVAVGGISTLVISVAIWYRSTAADAGVDLFTRYSGVYAALWGVVFTVATAVVSRVIYGLHEQVREAMRLGNYTLDAKLGEGGMGVVYRAHHALLRRPTAVKLLPPEKAGEHNVARFEREVQETSRLAHPNTVEIYDFGRTPDGIFYYVMEYLDGLDLRELVDMEGPQPPGRVVHVLAQVAHALADAHRAGLIHRDVKPANIILCNRGGVADMAKVVDFGLVKVMTAPAEMTLSANNTITGTPLYMAPECLLRPEEIDGRSDLYALGAVGYLLVTGKRLFDGESVMEVCGHHLHTDPESPSSRLGREVPADLEEVLLRALVKDPEERFPDAMAMREALLSCDCAADWGLGQASAWWSANEDRVRTFRKDRQAH